MVLFRCLLVAVLSGASRADAALLLDFVRNADPAPGLRSYTAIARGTNGDIVEGFAGVNFQGFHQVWPAFSGTGTPHAGAWGPTGVGALDPAWSKYDTYFLFDPADSSKVIGFLGSMLETNTGNDPAALSLSSQGLAATVGAGDFKFGGETDIITLTPSASGSAVPFLQLVMIPGAASRFSLTLYDSLGRGYRMEGAVPEPTCWTVAGIAVMSVVACGRHRRA